MLPFCMLFPKGNTAMNCLRRGCGVIRFLCVASLPRTFLFGRRMIVMGKHPDFFELEKLFGEGNDFELTESRYEKLTGAALPKNKYYLSNKSAIAKLARRNGYDVDVIEKTILLKKKVK